MGDLTVPLMGKFHRDTRTTFICIDNNYECPQDGSPNLPNKTKNKGYSRTPPWTGLGQFSVGHFRTPVSCTVTFETSFCLHFYENLIAK
jgi:hypothetical protein